MTKAKIVSNLKILGGKPIIAGTRISVELIMNFLGAGMSIKEIIVEYPELKKEEIVAAIKYTSKLVAKTKSRPIRNTAMSPIALHEITR